MRIERIGLEHHRDVARARRQVVDDLAADADRAAGDLLEARDHAQRRRFAAAGRPDQGDEFAIADRRGRCCARRSDGAIALDQLFERHRRHRYPFTAPEVRPDDEMLLDDESQRQRRRDHHHRQRAHAAPVDGEFGGVVEQADRQRLRIDRARQLRGEREFVPGGQEGEDAPTRRCRGRRAETRPSRTPASACSRRSAPPRPDRAAPGGKSRRSATS